MIFIFESNRLAAPILLPQPTTVNPFYSKNFAATFACLDYFIPNVIHSYLPLPQPSKSKHASAASVGIYLTIFIPSSRHELFPCKYKIQYFAYLCGVNTVKSKGI